MKKPDRDHRATVVYLSHGGGPLPILGDPSHDKMVAFLKGFAQEVKRPEAIVVCSAHWEEPVPTLRGGEHPPLLYDYYGFPREAYAVDYPLPGNPSLAHRIRELCAAAGISTAIDTERGFDHGVFIPLAIMYPQADIPTVQISLISGLDPLAHIRLGNALQELTQENILIIGSGFSFHNLPQFFRNEGDGEDRKNDEFQDALIEICTQAHTPEETEHSLIAWRDIPHARYCHPREEHLLPLHLCHGIAERPGRVVFDDHILGKRSIALVWE